MITRTIAFNVIAIYMQPQPYDEEKSLKANGLDEHDVAIIEDSLQEAIEKRYVNARIIKINSELSLDYIDKVIKQAI